MEVTVIDTGDLPANTIISFHTGSIRRHAHIEKDKAINLSCASGSEPVRVDLMSQVGSHTFHLVPGQDVYEVPMTPPEADGPEVKLKFQIREAAASQNGSEEVVPLANQEVNGVAEPKGTGGDANEFEPHCPISPSRKLQTALMMRSYLDDHDVLRQMQELLQDMVTHRPQDPIEYMIQRLEEVCRSDKHAFELEKAEGAAETPVKGAAPSAAQPKQEQESEDEDSEDDDEVGEELAPPPMPVKRNRACSVSEEAYGAFNTRKIYEKKVIPKDEQQKQRIRAVLGQSWMFQSHTPTHLNTIVDAMSEKVVPPGVRLINQGELGDVMWVIEEGILECLKKVDGEEKVVKTCTRGDVFGELALLYNCPRAASVVSKEKAILWELDRETFKAICYEAAQNSVPEYDGFSRPAGAAAAATAEDEEEGGEGADGVEPMPVKPARRREGVSAESFGTADDKWTPPVYEKTTEERQQLTNIIKTSKDSKLHMLFGTVSKDTFEKIVDAMSLKMITKGESVIEQGAVGDFFYIVKKGDFDIKVQKGEDPPKVVFQAGIGFAFGELALLYNAPRSATITSSVESEVWCLDRTAFRHLVVRSAEAQFQQHVQFLNGVDIFQALSLTERASLAEVLEEEEFEDDEAIVEQGERDDKMFIMREGKAVACIQGERGEVEVMQYSRGDYFGEIALLSGEPRKASVYAVGACTCLYITRSTFLRVLGPLQSILERNISKYEKYQDAMASADAAETQNLEDSLENSIRQTGDEEEFQGATALSCQKIVHRKRNRPEESLGNLGSKKRPAEAAETLAEKIALDMQNHAVVMPYESLRTDSFMMVYGGLASGQKFMMDKTIHVRTGVSAKLCGDDEVYSWKGVTKLQQATEIGVLCQKGQKSDSDPTPNQDNFFVHHMGAATMYGVCDGHGPFGHLVSFRIVQSLPYFISKRQQASQDWEVSLKEAFLDAQKDLVDFCSQHEINIEASGAACSVLVLEEQTVHIAFVGDSRIMLGSWNRRDSRMIFCTEDHKPEKSGEKERLEAAGSEVREIDPGNYRIYLPGSNFPGLTMSRAFGDLACNGLVVEPEYHKCLMQPTDQWYAIIASDGVWEFMDGEEVCRLTAKKLRLKGPRETLNLLVNASRKRWNYCCQDYCDDITALLVQWNAVSDNKESTNNHTLTVKRSA